MRRLGVIGTMVWDTIYGRGDQQHQPLEEWGGITYALAALEATLPSDWEIVPLVKVGQDLAAPAKELVSEFTKCADGHPLIEVKEPNNRVTLRYVSTSRRCEHLEGGVPPWRPEELLPRLEGLDALYLNFISGFEMSLDTARALRERFRGPIYADLHSLLLSLGSGGHRVPEPLDDASAWLECFDAVQVNEDEVTLIEPDGMAAAGKVLSRGVGLLLVTMGARGAAYFTVPSFRFSKDGSRDLSARAREPVLTEMVPAPTVEQVGDPTGCGDVFGASLVAQLVQAVPVREAVETANRYAAKNFKARGATGLHHLLSGRILSA